MSEEPQYIVLARVVDGPAATPSTKIIAGCGDECWISAAMAATMATSPAVGSLKTICMVHMLKLTGGKLPEEMQLLPGIREDLEARFSEHVGDKLAKEIVSTLIENTPNIKEI